MGVPLRVVSYNVHSQRDDTAALAAVVRGPTPDVVIVQEGPRRFRWRQKSATLADVVRPGGGRRRAARAGQPAADQPAGPGARHPLPCAFR